MSRVSEIQQPTHLQIDHALYITHWQLRIAYCFSQFLLPQSSNVVI